MSQRDIIVKKEIKKAIKLISKGFFIKIGAYPDMWFNVLLQADPPFYLIIS
jgi:hypothetical protein